MPKFHHKHKQYASIATRETRTEPSSQALAALVETMIIAACIDGMLEPGELDSLALQILATPGFNHLDRHSIGPMIEEIVTRIAEEGIGERVKAIAAAIGSDDRTREECFALATLFVLYDGEVGDEEQEFLEALQSALHLSDERASHISSLLADSD
ncbi:MAG: tellurite resistance TerB family protein [Polyangiales bacterium]